MCPPSRGAAEGAASAGVRCFCRRRRSKAAAPTVALATLAAAADYCGGAEQCRWRCVVVAVARQRCHHFAHSVPVADGGLHRAVSDVGRRRRRARAGAGATEGHRLRGTPPAPRRQECTWTGARWKLPMDSRCLRTRPGVWEPNCASRWHLAVAASGLWLCTMYTVQPRTACCSHGDASRGCHGVQPRGWQFARGGRARVARGKAL